MKKGYYSYQIFTPRGNGFMVAVRLARFTSLSDARLFAREHGIINGYIVRYHCFRGMEDKEYSL